MTILADIIRPVSGRAGANTPLPVYSVTKHSGFVPQSTYFKKKIASTDTSSYKVVLQNQFAYATIHLDEGSIGAAPEDCIVSPMYTVFSIDESRVYPQYLELILRSPSAISRYQGLGRGSAERRKSVNLKALGQLDIPITSMADQRRIASILDEADAIRTKRRTQLAQLDELPQVLFYEMFGSPSTWRKRWRFGTVDEMAKSIRYGSSKKAGTTGRWPMLRMGNVNNHGRLDVSDMKYVDLDAHEVEKYTVRTGDILFNRTNSLEKVGKSAVVRDEQDMAYAGYLVRVRLTKDHSPDYLTSFLNGPPGKRIRRNLAKAAVNQANINATQLRNIRLPLPPTETQFTFAEKVSAIDTERDRVARALEADDELFAALQHRAFRGEL